MSLGTCHRCAHESTRTIKSAAEAPQWLLDCDCRCHVPWKIVMQVPVKR